MTEREPEHELLPELLDNPGPASEPGFGADPILTRRDEQKLLDEANHVEPPTLAPRDISFNSLHPDSAQRKAAITSFGADALALVRRHPLTTLLIAAGLAYVLTQRRKTY